MKKSKFILSALLVGYLVTTSCTETRDPSKDVVYSFSADFICSKEVQVGINSLFNIRLASDVYNDGFIQHEGFYTDDKKSFLISPKGDTIKPGEKFIIPKIDEYLPFNFYSKDLGEHNLKFTFNNSMGETVTEDQQLLVDEPKFSFKITKQSAREVAVGTPIEIDFLIHPVPYNQRKIYEYKFYFENNGNESLEYYYDPELMWKVMVDKEHGPNDNFYCISSSHDDCFEWLKKYFMKEPHRPDHMYDSRSLDLNEGVGKFVYITRKAGVRNLKIFVKDGSGKVQTDSLTVKIIPWNTK